MNQTISQFLASTNTPEQFFRTRHYDINEIASAVIALEEQGDNTFVKSPRAPELVRWITSHTGLQLSVAFELDEFLAFNPLRELPEGDTSLEFIFHPDGHIPWGVETAFKGLDEPAQLAALRRVRLTPSRERQSHRMLKLLIICGSVNILDTNESQRAIINRLVAHAKEIIKNNGDDEAMTQHLVEAAFRIIEMVSL